jgi:5-formaminoimidazole-4-carboxamide-1-beta-D-ribofuranosyl 5'-monophosphate synthetase
LKQIRDELKSHGARLDRIAQEQIRHATAIVGLEGRMGDLADGQRVVVGELVKLNARFENVLTGTVGVVARETTARVEKLEETARETTARVDKLERRSG